MLICNNCNTVNEDHRRQCKHCQMKDNFRPQLGDRKSDNAPVAPSQVCCRNCGSDAPGEGPKCVHCRFPLKVTGRQQPVIAGEVASEVTLAIPSSEKQS